MTSGSEYEEVYTWLGDWPEGCSISHLASHFNGARPKKNLTKWLKRSQHLTVFNYDGVEDAAVRRNLNAAEDAPRSSSARELWHERFLTDFSFQIPTYDVLAATPTTTLEAVRSAILQHAGALTEMQRRIEEALDDRGWDDSEASTRKKKKVLQFDEFVFVCFSRRFGIGSSSEHRKYEWGVILGSSIDSASMLVGDTLR